MTPSLLLTFKNTEISLFDVFGYHNSKKRTSLDNGELFADFDTVPPECRYNPAGTEIGTGLRNIENIDDVLGFRKKKNRKR